MKIKKSRNKLTTLKKKRIELKSNSNLPKFGKIDGLEVDEVIFSLLDGLVDTNDRTCDTIIKTLMKYATYHPDFILKSILTFLQVQKTSVNHQHSLLCFVKRCLVELKNIPNGVIKEILIFMLKELSFLKNSDLRYVEMREIVNTATVLCPSFSVDVILAFIKDIKQSDENFEILCIYIRILAHLCRLVPGNSYVKSILISSHIMCLYNKQIFKEQNMEICKELSSLLFNLANMLISNSAHNHANYCQNAEVHSDGLVKLYNEENLSHSHTQLYESLDLEMGMHKRFNSIHKTHFSSTSSDCRGVDITNRVFSGYFVDLIPASVGSMKRRKISRPTIENIKNILEPLYGLMLDYYIPKIYINSTYNSVCLELLYSLVVISEYVSTECFRANSLNLLNCIIVRFLQYVPDLQFNDNVWFKLHKINSTNLTNRFVSLFSNLNLISGLPPKFFVIGLRSYLQILNQYNEHSIYVNSYNLCNIFFSLLITLYNNTNKYLLMYLQWFLSSNNGSISNDASKDLEFDSLYVDNIIQGITILNNCSSSLVLSEFLYDKLLSGTKSDVIVAMYILIFLFSGGTGGDRMNSMGRTDSIGSNNGYASGSFNGGYSINYSGRSYVCNVNRSYSGISSRPGCLSEVGNVNQIMMYRIINNINGILNLNINDNYSLYIMVKFVNMLFVNKGIMLYSAFNSMFDKGDMERRNKKIYFIINYVFEYKINIDINNRINRNMKWYNTKSSSKLDLLFFYSLYQNNGTGKNELSASKFLKNELVTSEQELFDQCIENFINSCNEYFLVYLVNKLMKNVKRNSLTIFTYLNKVFKLYTGQRIRRILTQQELYSLLVLVLIYIHDPVYYFGEAYHASKLLFKLYEYVSSTRYIMSGDIGISTCNRYDRSNGRTNKGIIANSSLLKQKLIEEGIMYTDLSTYDKVDYFYIKHSETTKHNDADNDRGSEDIERKRGSDGNVEPENESFILPDDIVLNFSNISKLIRHLNVIYNIDRVGVMRCINMLMEHLKDRPNISRNSSFSITTSSFLNTGSTLFGGNQVSPFRVNDIAIDTDLTTFHNLGILNLICTFTTDKEGIIGTVLSNANVSSATNKEDMMAMTRDEQFVTLGDEVLFWSKTLDMKYKLYMLSGISLSNLIKRENWKEYMLKLDNVLISNTLKDSSFSLFGKTASYLQSERNRLIGISALAHLYIQSYDYIGLDGSLGSKLNVDSNCESQTESDMQEKGGVMKKFNDKYSRIVGVIISKRDRLLAEREGKVEKQSEDRESGYEDDLVNRYILCPMINMFNNETDVNVQECILNNLLLIINQVSFSKMRGTKHLDHGDYNNKSGDEKENGAHFGYLVRNDIELISVLFNKLITIIMKLVDENVKMTDQKIEQMFENNEVLNLGSFNKSVTEKEGALAYCAFLVMASFSPHFRLLRNTNVPYLVMYYLLYYSDYCFYSKVAKFDVNFSFSYEFHRSLRIFRYVHYYLIHMYNNISHGLKRLRSESGKSVDDTDKGGLVYDAGRVVGGAKANKICWDVLYNMIITILSDNNINLDNMLIKSKLFVLVQFLDALLPLGSDVSRSEIQHLEAEHEDNWTKIVILVWCHILKLTENNTKLLLIDILHRLLSAPSTIVSEDTHVTNNGGAVNAEKIVNHGVRMDRISKLNSVESIDKLIPERLVVKFVLFSINYLEASSYISNSLVKIIHRLIQQNMSVFTVEHLQSSLSVIFKRFQDYFQNNNLPLFLRSFLLDILKHNINILFEVLFKYSLKFQSSVILIIIKNEYLLHLLIEKLDFCVNNQLNEYFHLDMEFNRVRKSYGSVCETDRLNENVREACMDRSEFTLEYMLEYNMIIFGNNTGLTSCYSDYINLLIVYVNVMDSINNDLNLMIKEKKTLEAERSKMVKLLEVIYGNSTLSRNALLYYSVKIIGSNRSTLKSFLVYTYNVMCLFNEPVACQDDNREDRESRGSILKGVLMSILISLIRYKMLTGYDLMVLKIMKKISCNYELTYYYLRNMYSSGINPYYNVYAGSYLAVSRRRRAFLNGLIKSMVLSLDEIVPSQMFYYYVKVLAVLVELVKTQKLKRHYGSIENLICVVVKSKTFFVSRRLRHSYLVFFSSILSYLISKHGNLNRFENLKSYLMFPTAVAMLSSGTRKLERVSTKYLRLAFSLFFGNWFDLRCVNLCEEILSGLMVRGNTMSRCVCNCNSELDSSGFNCNDVVPESETLLFDSRDLCICNSFQLLHIFSHFLPGTDAHISRACDNSGLNQEAGEEGLAVPASINEEFRSIKRSQLDRKSSKVLFSSINMEEEEQQEFIDINEYYDLRLTRTLPLNRTSSSEDRPERLRTYSTASINSGGFTDDLGDECGSLQFSKMGVCPDVLIPLDVCDYTVKVGTAKSNFMYNSDSLDEYFQKSTDKNNLSLLQVKSLNSISNSFLFLSKNIYRFIVTQRYLQCNLIDFNFSPSSLSDNNDRTFFSFKSAPRSESSTETLRVHSPGFEDSVVFNAIKLSVFLITRASLYIYRSNICSHRNLPLEDLEPFGIHKSLTVIRRNHLIHFESLCNVVVSKLCKLIEDDKFKLYVYRQLQLLSNISPTNL